MISLLLFARSSSDDEQDRRGARCSARQVMDTITRLNPMIFSGQPAHPRPVHLMPEQPPAISFGDDFRIARKRVVVHQIAGEPQRM
jgi:hypothetical protein